MSKERELLNRCAVTLKARLICPLLLMEISELLNEPEQEPIAYVADPSVGFDVSRSTQGLTPREALTEYKRGYARAELDLKREPLSEDEIRTIVNQLPTEVDLDTGIEFCRIIEKAHGIGGGE